MNQLVKLLALILYSTTLLASTADGKQQMNNGRETRLNGHFKSSTGNWCSWTEALSDETSTIISIACQCMGKIGERQAYTCQYISQGELLHDCKASRPKSKDIYDEIGVLLAGKSLKGLIHKFSIISITILAPS